MTDIVGWKEWVALPDLGIDALQCKVDTGAKNSAIHAFEVNEFKKGNESWVRFYIHLDEDDLSKVQTCEALIKDTRSVTDSGGNSTERYFIETTLEIGNLKYVIPVSLTNRDTMAFKMLLGRTALRKARLLVNPKKSFLQGKK